LSAGCRFFIQSSNDKAGVFFCFVGFFLPRAFFTGTAGSAANAAASRARRSSFSRAILAESASAAASYSDCALAPLWAPSSIPGGLRNCA
jgi:hypothetical protein